MSKFHRGTFWVCVICFTTTWASAVHAEGWNPLSIFSKKKAAPAYRPVVPASAEMPIPQLKVPQLKVPQVNVPQLRMPQVNAPQNLPQIGQGIPNVTMPQFGTQNSAPAVGNMIDKWNQGTKQKLDKVRDALTLPKIQLPALLGGAGAASNGAAPNPFLQPLMNKLPFGLGGAPQAQKKSLLPQWLSGKPAQQQPPTLNNWLNQPRPQ